MPCWEEQGAVPEGLRRKKNPNSSSEPKSLPISPAPQPCGMYNTAIWPTGAKY